MRFQLDEYFPAQTLLTVNRRLHIRPVLVIGSYSKLTKMKLVLKIDYFPAQTLLRVCSGLHICPVLVIGPNSKFAKK